MKETETPKIGAEILEAILAGFLVMIVFITLICALV